MSNSLVLADEKFVLAIAVVLQSPYDLLRHAVQSVLDDSLSATRTAAFLRSAYRDDYFGQRTFGKLVANVVMVIEEFALRRQRDVTIRPISMPDQCV